MSNRTLTPQMDTLRLLFAPILQNQKPIEIHLFFSGIAKCIGKQARSVIEKLNANKRHQSITGGVYLLGHGFLRTQKSTMVRTVHTT